MMTEYNLDDTSKCIHCGEAILFTGKHWEHKNGTPRHPGQPVGAVTPAKPENAPTVEGLLAEVEHLTSDRAKMQGQMQELYRWLQGAAQELFSVQSALRASSEDKEEGFEVFGVYPDAIFEFYKKIRSRYKFISHASVQLPNDAQPIPDPIAQDSLFANAAEAALDRIARFLIGNFGDIIQTDDIPNEEIPDEVIFVLSSLEAERDEATDAVRGLLKSFTVDNSGDIHAMINRFRVAIVTNQDYQSDELTRLNQRISEIESLVGSHAIDKDIAVRQRDEARRELGALKQAATFVLNAAKEQGVYSEGLNAVNAGHTPSEWTMVPIPYKWLRKLNDATDPAPAPAAETNDGDFDIPLALYRDIATLSDVMGLGCADWSQADDETLLEQFDPWAVIKEATKRAAAAPAQPEREGLLESQIELLTDTVCRYAGVMGGDRCNALNDGGKLASKTLVELNELRAQAATRPDTDGR